MSAPQSFVRFFHYRVGNVCILSVLILLALVGCRGDDDPLPTAPTVPETAADFTARGWTRYEAENISGALSDFDRALELDPESGEALAGRGWSLVPEAASPALMLDAANVFSSAVDAGEDGAYVLAGRAGALLGASADYLTAAVSEAQSARAADTEFVFSHRPSITGADLRLIEAIALVIQGNLTDALSAADPIQPSGIDRTDPMTWVVEEVTHDTFAGAVLAYLDMLSRQSSG